MRTWYSGVGLTTKVSGAGAPQVRRAPTQAMRMPKAWPLVAGACASALNRQLDFLVLISI